MGNVDMKKGKRKRAPLQHQTEHMLVSCSDRVDVEDRLPVFAQDVEAHVAFEVDVRVVNGRVAEHLGVTEQRISGRKERKEGGVQAFKRKNQ